MAHYNDLDKVARADRFTVPPSTTVFSLETSAVPEKIRVLEDDNVILAKALAEPLILVPATKDGRIILVPAPNKVM